MTLVTAVVPDKADAGCNTVPDAVVVQRLASVMVTVYTPAATLTRSSVVAPLLHRYVYGAVPPVTVRLTDPVGVPKHLTFTTVVPAVRGIAGWVIRKGTSKVQKFASLIVTI
ncbi:MAG: hypothetical protein BWX96_01951 [Bacteroidetes bacterium ADurb.Bin145]|nr:MAG: hypothetical protein BWX96_01951 [Bacteroidetes bacterium ADurb.Bin145]